MEPSKVTVIVRNFFISELLLWLTVWLMTVILPVWQRDIRFTLAKKGSFYTCREAAGQLARSDIPTDLCIYLAAFQCIGSRV
jgi:hypothetical protein